MKDLIKVIDIVCERIFFSFFCFQEIVENRFNTLILGKAQLWRSCDWFSYVFIHKIRFRRSTEEIETVWRGFFTAILYIISRFSNLWSFLFQVLSNDFFLTACLEDFRESARLLIFEMFCRIHQCISIAMLAERLNMQQVFCVLIYCRD